MNIAELETLLVLKKYKHIQKAYEHSEMDLGDSKSLLIVGRAYYKDGQIFKAEEVYQILLSIDPRSLNAQFELAKSCMSHDKKQSEFLLNQCIGQNPEEPAYWGLLGCLYFEKKEFGKAAKSFEKVLKYHPKDIRSMVNLATSYSSTKQFSKAIKLLKRAIALNPEYYNAYLNLGVLLSDNGNYAEANEYYLQCLKFNPMASNAIYGIACLASLQKEYEKSIKYLKRALEIKPELKDDFNEDPDFDNLRSTGFSIASI